MPAKLRRNTSSRRPLRRALKIFAGVAIIGAIGWFAYASVNIVLPSQGALDDKADVVVSLAPQQNRLPMAKQLISDDVAETLLISYFDHDPMNHQMTAKDGVPLSRYCEDESENGVMCFTPAEDATIGEVHAISDLAQEHAWGKVTVVTDSFHAFRTRFIFEQCMDAEVDVNVVFSEQDLTASQWSWHIVYENAAFLKAAWQTTARC
ncbi:YdcF family protein [Yaniella halotolerans]|uniref:YdcF family protein n=1 Tax=Yaniella halotolerans TaxID=225453 RepID=UPI0003B4F80F|nr:YdcF family protein [Yaniella halotolerans]